MIGGTYVAEEEFFAHAAIDGFAVETRHHFGIRHRFKVYHIVEEGVIFGFDPVWYGDSTNRRQGHQRFILPKDEFDKKMISMRDFNLRWLKSLHDDDAL